MALPGDQAVAQAVENLGDAMVAVQGSLIGGTAPVVFGGPDPQVRFRNPAGADVFQAATVQGAAGTGQTARWTWNTLTNVVGRGDFNWTVFNNVFETDVNPVGWFGYNIDPNGVKPLPGEGAVWTGMEGYYNAGGGVVLLEWYAGFGLPSNPTQFRWLMATFDRANGTTTTFIAGDSVSIKMRDPADKASDAYSKQAFVAFPGDYTFNAVSNSTNAGCTLRLVPQGTTGTSTFRMGYGATANAFNIAQVTATHTEIRVNNRIVMNMYDTFGGNNPTVCISKSLSDNSAAIFAHAPATTLFAAKFAGSDNTVRSGATPRGLPFVNTASLAASGTTIGTSAVLSAGLTLVTSADANNTAVRLPAAADGDGETLRVFNSDTSRTVLVFPNTIAEQINNGSPGASFSVAPGRSCEFVRYSSTRWVAFYGA